MALPPPPSSIQSSPDPAHDGAINGFSVEYPYTLHGHHSFLGSYFQSSSSSQAESSGSLASPHASLPPKTSSTTAMYQTALTSPRAAAAARRLRSQYPIDSPETHVEFILVASFDIDRGSVMEFQYPSSISGDEHMLAELMLPDQVHNRSQDWTIFFLHKDANADPEEEEEQAAARIERRMSRRRDLESEEDGAELDAAEEEEDEDEDERAIEGPPLIYVLNLVNTKHDDSVRRGAIVKAMAICTRHPFLHIYKPLLLLALDAYFKSPTLETLASLYDAANNMDLSLMPRLSLLERNILQATTVKDMFMEKFHRMIQQRDAEEASNNGGGSPHRQLDGRSMTPPARMTLPRDTHEFESKVHYNGISVPIKVPTARSPETVGDFSIIKLIQTFSTPHAQSVQPFALHPHLTTGGANTHPIIVLVNALLTQKRVIFLGHNMPSGDVADAVLASCALVSGGLLRGFTRHAFPYTDLTKVDDLLKVPGFVAGVTNPTFLNKPEWWDLLCDLPTGRMKISSQIEQPRGSKGIESFHQQNPSMSGTAVMQSLLAQDATGDAAFMDNILRNITSRLGEGVIRSMWRDWIVKLVRIAAAFEESVYGASALYIGGEEADAGAFGIRGHGYVWSDETARIREMAGNLNRIEGWRNTRTYYSLVQDMALLHTSRPITSIDLHHHHDRLRQQKLGKDESAAIYLALEQAVRSPAEICQLLTVTPESHGGLFYLSLGLLHPRKDVRAKTVALLERVQEHEAGRHFWNGLGRFTKTAFARIKKELVAAASPSSSSPPATGMTDTSLSQTLSLPEQTSLAY